MTLKNTFIGFMMLLAAGLAAWTSFLSYRPQAVVVAQVSQTPDAFLEDVVAVFLDKQGKPTMKIVTPKMVHFTHDDTTQLTTPQLTLYRRSPKPWYITSQYAKATQGIENVHFSQNVVIHHAADGNNPATLIKTPTLLVHPNEQTAETDALITLLQPNLVVKATGMLADMNTGNIRLLSRARGEYAPNS